MSHVLCSPFVALPSAPQRSASVRTLRRLRTCPPTALKAQRPQQLRFCAAASQSESYSPDDRKSLEDVVKLWSPNGVGSKHDLEQLAECHLEEWERCEDKAAQARERVIQLSACQMRERAVVALEKLQVESGYSVEGLKLKLRKLDKHRERVSSKYFDYKAALEERVKR